MVAERTCQIEGERMDLVKDARHIWKGLLFCLVIAVPAWLLGKQFEVIGGPVFAILIGMVLALVVPGSSAAPLEAGVKFTSKKILQYAVILLGFGLNLAQIAQVGATSLPIIMSTIATSLIISFVLCRALRIPSKISTLVGVGSSICGGSAIAATAPVIDADDEEIAQAISVIFLFNVIAALVFPTLGGMRPFERRVRPLRGHGGKRHFVGDGCRGGMGWYASRRQHARFRHDRQAYAHARYHPHHAGACVLAGAEGQARCRRGPYRGRTGCGQLRS